MEDKEQIAEILKNQILEVENSRKDPDPNKRIVTVHLEPSIFLKMAYLFVGFHGK